MRIILIFILVTILSENVSAQKTLEFNRVVKSIFNDSNANTPSGITVGTITVPANKVLKIEFASLYHTHSGEISQVVHSSSGRDANFMLVSDYMVWAAIDVPGNTIKTPIWVPSGTHSVVVRLGGTNKSFRAVISSIEFNIN